MISLHVHTISCTIIMFAIILKCLARNKETKQNTHYSWLVCFCYENCFIYRCAAAASTGVRHHHLQVRSSSIYRCASSSTGVRRHHLHVCVIIIHRCEASLSTSIKHHYNHWRTTYGPHTKGSYHQRVDPTAITLHSTQVISLTQRHSCYMADSRLRLASATLRVATTD